ncbi:MAG: hypothetical protein U0165_18010 [Polyangiaceae bacterium]
MTVFGTIVPNRIAMAVSRRPEHAPSSLSIARVDVLLRRELALVTTDVTFARGTLADDEGLDVFVAYNSPGIPKALDAQLIPVAEGSFVTPVESSGVVLTLEHSTSAPESVTFSLGGMNQAGAVIHIPGKDLTKALAPSGLVTLRIRSVQTLSAQAIASRSEASVVVRAATPLLGPFPIGIVSVRGDNTDVSDATASLCSRSNVGAKLSLSTGPRRDGTVAPPLARHALDEDLCVRAVVKKTNEASRPAAP